MNLRPIVRARRGAGAKLERGIRSAWAKRFMVPSYSCMGDADYYDYDEYCCFFFISTILITIIITILITVTLSLVVAMRTFL